MDISSKLSVNTTCGSIVILVDDIEGDYTSPAELSPQEALVLAAILTKAATEILIEGE